MKSKLTNFGQVLLLAALAAFLPLCATAQQVTVNKVYGFSGSADTFNNQINYVYADSSRIIAMGQIHPDGQKPYTFTAAFDYSGNLLWEKRVRLAEGLYTTSDSGYNNLIKAAPDLYVAGGNIVNAPKRNHTTGIEPFLYFFNSQGDSLRLLRLPDSSQSSIINALTVDSAGKIIAGGENFSIEPNPTLGYDTTKGIWLAKLNTSGSLLQMRQIPPQFPGIVSSVPFYAITNIIPINIGDGIRYILATNTGLPFISGKTINLDSSLEVRGEGLDFYLQPFFPAPAPTLSGITINATEMSHFEFNLIARKGHPNSYFWSFPVTYADPNSSPLYENILNGLYFSKCYMKPHVSYTEYQRDWYQSFISNDTFMPPYASCNILVQDRSELAEAVNGDLLVQKEASRYVDTINFDYQNGSTYFPILLRSDAAGHIKWGKEFQHLHTTDTGVYHDFYDLSVAPDGKIVMGGFVRTLYPVPGYDTVGKVAWLVVVSDTLHDLQPQPPEAPEGISLSAAGQQAKLLVYPNPTLNNATLELKDFKGAPEGLSWQLYDLNGRLLQSGKLTQLKTVVHLNGFAAGAYLLKASYKGKPAGEVKLLKE